MLTGICADDALQSKTWLRFYEIVMGLVGFLRQHGVERSSVVAIDAAFRCEVLSLWCACQYLGAVALFFPTDMRSKEKAAELLSVGAKVLFVDEPNRVKVWLDATQASSALEAVVYFDVKTADGTLIDRVLGWPLPEKLCSFESAVERGAREDLAFEPLFIAKDATIAMAYSQGRSGPERRIELTVSALKHQAVALNEAVGSQKGDHILTDLRSIHACNLAIFAYCIHEGLSLVFACTEDVDWLKIISNTKIHYAFLLPSTIAKLSLSLEAANVNGMISAQWERLSQVAAKFRKRSEGPLLAWSKPLINRLFLQQYKQKISTLKAIISYGNRFDTRLAERFSYLDIAVFNAYTVAEASGFAHLHQYLGEGRFLQALETRIKHGVLSLRYRQCGEAYESTGDLVVVDARGGIFVRKAHSITLDDGTSIETSTLSDAIMREKLIEDIFIFGEGEAYLTALIYLRADALIAWARQQKIVDTQAASLTQHPKVYAYIKSEVDACNRMRASKEAIRKIALLPSQLSEDKRVLTPCKLTRHHEVARRYASILKSFYDDAF